MKQASEPVNLLPARKVWERYGVSRLTISRWLETPDLSFPLPVVISGRRYWHLEKLLSWEESRSARPAKAA